MQLVDADVAQQDFAALTADYDVVIAHRLPNSAPWPASVHVTPLAYEPLGHCRGRRASAGRTQSLTPQDLRGERWISVHQGFPLEGAIEMIGTLAGEEVDVAHRINEFFVAASLVEQGGCVSLMPRYTVDRTYLSRTRPDSAAGTEAGPADRYPDPAGGHGTGRCCAESSPPCRRIMAELLEQRRHPRRDSVEACLKP